MARPMYLIKRGLLEELHTKQRDGVPISRLISQYALNITPPTLTKLIMYYDAMLEAGPGEVQDMIKASLFPEWLSYDVDADIVLQHPHWRYTGRMPLGNWEEI